MNIVKLTGGTSWQQRAAAQYLRSKQVDAGKGCTIILQDEQHPLVGQLEKIVSGMPLHAGMKLEEIPWKPDPLIILVGEGNWLARVERHLPGFTEKFGPVVELPVPL